ncbi:MAG: type II secretion system protein [Gallionella sp.]|nr:type II secretion system protein [Gallionella sp.]
MYIKSRIQDSGFRIQDAGSRMRARGASLIELIMFIVIVSVAVAGILLVMNVTTSGSADPLLNKQAMVAAYSLLEEVELQDFLPASGAAGAAVTQANRASVYHIVNDYHGFNTTGIYSVTDSTSASAILPTYNASVAVVPMALNGIAAGSAVQINVTVTSPNGGTVTATGYRTAY